MNYKVDINKKFQLDATVCRHLFTAESPYMFRASQHLSSGVLKTVSSTSGISHDTGTATSFHRGLIGIFIRWMFTCNYRIGLYEDTRHFLIVSSVVDESLIHVRMTRGCKVVFVNTSGYLCLVPISI